jgi:hypothetical protein
LSNTNWQKRIQNLYTDPFLSMKSLDHNELLFKPASKERLLCHFPWTYRRGYPLRKVPRMHPFPLGFHGKVNSEAGA